MSEKLSQTANEIYEEAEKKVGWVQQNNNDFETFYNEAYNRLNEVKDNQSAAKNRLKKATVPTFWLVLAVCLMLISVFIEPWLIMSIAIGLPTTSLAVTGLFILLAILVLIVIVTIGIWVLNTLDLAKQNLNKTRMLLTKSEVTLREAHFLKEEAKNTAEVTKEEIGKTNATISNLVQELEKTAGGPLKQ